MNMNIIKVNVNFKNRTITKQGVDLTEGDYNSTKMVFTFDREDGTKVLEMKNPNDEIVLHAEIENNEVVLVGYADVITTVEDVTYIKYTDENENIYWYDEESEKLYDSEFVEVQNVTIDELTKVTTEASIFNEVGNYTYEVVLYDGDSKLTSASDYIKIKKKQIDTDGETAVIYKPVFDEMMGDLNEALDEVDNLDIDVSKSGSIATVTISKKDGTSESVNISDGESGPANTLTIGTVSKGENASATITGTSPNQILNLVLPKGDKGDTGETGPQGIPGTNGTNGTNGQDGFSPIATVTQTQSGATISITDKNGTTTATISDGEEYDDREIRGLIDEKQDELVSGTNIKTINNTSILGSGNIDIQGGGTSDYSNLTNKPSINNVTLSGNKTSSNLGLQDILVSGNNIKTINNTSILGSGNIDIQGGSDTVTISYYDDTDAEIIQKLESIFDENGNIVKNAVLYKESYLYFLIAGAMQSGVIICNFSQAYPDLDQNLNLESTFYESFTFLVQNNELTKKRNITQLADREYTGYKEDLEVNREYASTHPGVYDRYDFRYAINLNYSLAKGTQKAISFSDYQTMITRFNTLGKDYYNVGQSVYIVTLNVPDLWVSGMAESSSTYTYVDDATFINDLQTNGYVQVGYHRFSMLETLKVDLTNYQTLIDSSNKLSSDLVDDTNSTNKFVTNSEKSTWDLKYDKPSGGIPSTDLSSAVQTSLEKANTAIQDISSKQDVLVDGLNLKTINYTSLLGSENIDVLGDLKAKTGIIINKVDEWTSVKTDVGMGSTGRGWTTTASNGQKAVCLGTAGYVAVSENGMYWSEYKVNNLGSNNWHGIGYGADKFVALSFTGHISTSTDGITWTEATQNSNLSTRNWQKLAYGNNTFVALGGAGYVSTSSDGTTWANSSYKVAIGGQGGSWLSLAYGNGKFVALATNGNIATSEDGTTWVSQTTNISSNSWVDLTFFNDKFYALGSGGYLTSSADGIVWDAPIILDDLSGWRAISYISDILVAIGANGKIINTKPIREISTSDTKVTSISSSSTDDEIPSAKAVYDYIQSLLNNN